MAGRSCSSPFQRDKRKAPGYSGSLTNIKGMDKSTTFAKRKQEARKAKQNSDFISRNYNVYYIIGIILYPIAALYSAITEGGALFTRFQETLPVWLAVVITVLIVFMIETGVLIFGRSCVNDIRHGVFGEGPEFQRMFAVKTLFFIVFFGFSVFLSITGAPDTNHYIAEVQSPPTLIPLDSVEAKYQIQVDSAHMEAQKYYNMRTWAGRIASEDAARYNELMDIKLAKEDTLAVKVAAAKAENDRRTAEWRAAVGQTGSSAQWIAGLGQLVLLGSLIISVIYLTGEINLIDIAEDITGQDLNGDGKVGTSPPLSGAEAKSPPTELNPDAIAAAVAAEIDKRQPERRTIKFMGEHNPKGHSTGPDAKTVHTHVAEPVEPKPVEAVSPVAQAPQPVTTVTTETVHVVVSDLKKEITTYYPRCFSKEVTEKGSKYPATQQKNRQRVEAKIAELKQYGIDANVNFETYQTPITWKSTN